MEVDLYWRTRTISEAQAQSYTHLRATCPSCGRIADVPWQLLSGRKGTNRNTFPGEHSAEVPTVREHGPDHCREVSQRPLMSGGGPRGDQVHVVHSSGRTGRLAIHQG